jgi:ribosome-associated protein
VTVGAMKDLMIRTDYIHLDQALKLAGLAGSGGEAKAVIQDGLVSVNGATEMRRGRKLRPGDVIEFGGIVMRIVWKMGDCGESDDACSADSGAPNQERTGGGCVGKSNRAH